MTTNGSKSYSLNGTDGKKIAKGALIAVVGALLAYVGTTIVPMIQQSEELQGTVFVLGCVLFNALWKFWQDNQVSTDR